MLYVLYYVDSAKLISYGFLKQLDLKAEKAPAPPSINITSIAPS
jgi:hypothetical protein